MEFVARRREVVPFESVRLTKLVVKWNFWLVGLFIKGIYVHASFSLTLTKPRRFIKVIKIQNKKIK